MIHRLSAAVRAAPARTAATAISAWGSLHDAADRLTPLHWSWIHAKVALGIWSVLLLAFTPIKVAAAWGNVLTWAVSGITLSGCVISLIGLVLAAPDPGTILPTRRTLRGLVVELFGLWWMLLGGLGAYTLTQLALSFGPEGDQRIALTAFGYSHCAFLICRIAMVTHRRRKEQRLAVARRIS